jgi:hypothetical protein
MSGSCCYIVYHYCLRFNRERFMLLWLLNCLPLLFKVWQNGGSCCCCFIIYHYCLRFDREVVHVTVVILSTITVYVLTEEWLMLWLLYCLTFLFKVWQRSGSCCCGCYIVYYYCLRFDKEWFMLLWLLYCLPLLLKVWRRSGSCCCWYIVYHYCLTFDRGVVYVVVVIFSTITVSGLTEEWLMLLWLLYCLPLLFRFDRGVVDVVVVILYAITVYCLTEECFILLLVYCLPLLC